MTVELRLAFALFPLLITAIPRTGLVEEQHGSLVEEQHGSLVEEQHSSLVEEQHGSLVEEQHGSLSVSVGVFGIHGEVNLTSSLDLRR